MTSPVDIRPDQLEIVQDILREHLPAGVKVWVFGSRANWTTKDSSDLDLALEGEGKLNHRVLGALKDAFEDSTLPYTVDVVDFNRIGDSFKQIVELQRTPLPLDGVVTHGADLTGTSGEWGKATLGDVCTKIGSGATPRGGRDVYLESGPYSLIRSQNVYNDGFRRDGLAFIGEHYAHALENVEVFEGDVLLNITGDSVARTCQVPVDALPARVNQHVAIVRPDSAVLDPEYLRYYLVSAEMQTLLLSWAGSGGTRNALTKGMIESLEVPLPPLQEQQAIAHVLGTLDGKIELNRRVNETLEAMARALFKSWFVDFDPVRAKMEGLWHRGESLPGLPAEVYDLFPDRLVDSELGEIPVGWEMKPLSDCIDLARGLSYKGSGLASTGIPMHNLNSIYEGGGYKEDGIKYYNGKFQDRHVTQPGDVLVANTEQGHDRLLIGFAAIVPKHLGDKGLFSHHLYRIQPNRSSALSADYVCQLLNTRSMHGIVSGYATGTTVNMLPPDALLIPSIVVPPSRLVTMFSRVAEAARERQYSLLTECENLAAQRDGLLPGLVSGEVGI